MQTNKNNNNKTQARRYARDLRTKVKCQAAEQQQSNQPTNPEAIKYTKKRKIIYEH